MRIASIVLLFYCCTAFAQKDLGSVPLYKPFVFITDYKDYQSEFVGWSLSGDASIASSSVNTQMLSDFMFNNRFTDVGKNAFINNTTSPTFLSAEGRISLKNHGTLKSKAYTWEAYYSNVLYSYTNKDFVQMLLFGNAPYAGKLVESGSTELLQFEKLGFLYSRELIESNQWSFSMSIGPSVYANINWFKADNVSLFTEPEGEYLDVSVNNAKWLLNSNNPDGLGLDLGFNVKYSVSESSFINLEVNDISPTWIFGNPVYSLDTNFRFEGLELNPNDIISGDAASIAEQFADSTFFRDSANNSFMMMPIKASIAFQHYLNEKHVVGLRVFTRNINFGTALEFTYLFKPSPLLAFNTKLGYGNFNRFYITEEIEAIISNKWNVYARLHGLNSAISPSKSMTYGLSIGVAKTLSGV